ncbi:MAG: hypothetical protein H0V07_01920 [Propionibacteriales bacterium]|nr:hypothetical protein [Propionibacteriales bacterium]
MQASLFATHLPAVADAFCASRLGPDRSVAFGALPAGLDLDAIIDRARPAASRTTMPTSGAAARP